MKNYQDIKWSRLAFVFGFLLISSCATLVRMPEGGKTLNPEQAEKAWGRVLKEFVNEKGEVSFKKLSQKRGDLDDYVTYIAKVGPKTKPAQFSNPSTLLAHYLNSYNALSMYNILDSEIPESLSGLKKVKFFYFKKFVIDGVEMSLYAYENAIIRKVGEERVHFALNCMSKGCPRLPRVPFTGKNLDKELAEQARFFFSEERNVRVDEKEKKVYLSEILDFFPKDFLAKAPNLIAYANRHRPKAKALLETFEVDFISYDWNVNNAERKADEH
ncbi:MAG: DUF547 domain-containing protein [Deltaproteobacteria bacterium]|nr:DUF547 domain-containing protein [Deltaproteobacteria bacterium]MBM4316544.1 DUF547 domain-containing protein [Deltaproteobacteria bacterium]